MYLVWPVSVCLDYNNFCYVVFGVGFFYMLLEMTRLWGFTVSKASVFSYENL